MRDTSYLVCVRVVSVRLCQHGRNGKAGVPTVPRVYSGISATSVRPKKVTGNSKTPPASQTKSSILLQILLKSLYLSFIRHVGKGRGNVLSCDIMLQVCDVYAWVFFLNKTYRASENAQNVSMGPGYGGTFSDDVCHLLECIHAGNGVESFVSCNWSFSHHCVQLSSSVWDKLHSCGTAYCCRDNNCLAELSVCKGVHLAIGRNSEVTYNSKWL